MTDINALAVGMIGLGGVVCLWVVSEVILAFWGTRQRKQQGKRHAVRACPGGKVRRSMEKGIKGRMSRKNAATSISPEARKLILATLKKCKGSESAAARVLRLPVRSQLGRMLRGEMRETPAMKAAVIRAKARAADAARKAFVMDRSDCGLVEIEQLRKKLDEILVEIQIARSIIG